MYVQEEKICMYKKAQLHNNFTRESLRNACWRVLHIIWNVLELLNRTRAISSSTLSLVRKYGLFRLKCLVLILPFTFRYTAHLLIQPSWKHAFKTTHPTNLTATQYIYTGPSETGLQTKQRKRIKQSLQIRLE